MINQWLESLSTLISQSMWISPLLALLAGVLTSVTPCALSSVPLVIGYVGSTGGNNPKKAFRLSLTFAIGMSLTFTAMGTVASLAGKLMGTTSKWWYIVLGILMVMMALQIWEIYNFIPSTYLLSKNRKKVFSSPCATPVLIVLLGIVARSGNVIWGVILLLLYSIGHSVLVLIAGTSIGFVTKITTSPKYGVFSKVLKISLGAVIILMAFYMFYLGF